MRLGVMLRKSDRGILSRDKHAINTAVKWMQPLTFAWMGVIREHRGVGVAEAMPGAKLTELVCTGHEEAIYAASETVKA